MCSGERLTSSAQKSFGYAKKYDIHGIKRYRDKKIKKYSKKHFTSAVILGIIDRQSERRAETEH